MRHIKMTRMLSEEESLQFKILRWAYPVQTLLFPVHFSKWTVKAKNILGKSRKHRVIVGLDLMNGKFGFAEKIPASSDEVMLPRKVVNSQVAIDTKKDALQEHIRNYFIHYKKVWSSPVIELEKEEVIYMPYTVFSSDRPSKKTVGKSLLLEHHTRNLDYLHNHPHIEKFFLPILKGSETE